MSHLFLNEPEQHVQQTEEVITPITNTELIRPCSKLGNNKSSDLNRIPNNALKLSRIFPDSRNNKDLSYLQKGKQHREIIVISHSMNARLRWQNIREDNL